MLRIVWWRTLASLALGLGALGVVLPGVPTVPFLLLAAWAGGRGWPQLEQRLLAHPVHGPLIRDWRERRAVPRRAKWLASVLIAASAVMVLFGPVPDPVRWLVPPVLVVVVIWLWSRPDA